MGDWFCTYCNADLEEQFGFDPDLKRWTCQICGHQLLNPDDDNSDDRFSDVTWYCDCCGACLNDQVGFSDWEDEWVCSECGHTNPISASEIRSDDDDDEYYDNDDNDNEYIEEHYCTNCGAFLDQQDGYDPDEGYWQCTNCGTMLYSPEYDDASARFEGVTWFCDNCGAFLNKQSGFSDWRDEWECTECGHVNTISESEIRHGNDDGDEDDEYDDEDQEEEENVEEDSCSNISGGFFDTLANSNYSLQQQVSSNMQNAGTSQYSYYKEPSGAYSSGQTGSNTLKWIKYILVAAALLAVFLFGLYKYREDKVRIPFNPSYARSKTHDEIVAELKNAGFIGIVEKAEDTGWLESERVIEVSFDGNKTYKKGKYLDPNVTVVVRYSSGERIDVTDLLREWTTMDSTRIKSVLDSVGFSNVEFKEVITPEKEKNKKLAELMLNGEKYKEGPCYLPINAPIVISYYVHKIAIGSSNQEFYGQDYKEVKKSLETRGFTNIQVTEYKRGWLKGDGVVSIAVNDQEDYTREMTFFPDEAIVIKYSSNDRIDITATVDFWKTQTKESLQTRFDSAGIKNYIFRESNGEDISIEDYMIVGMNINYVPYSEGECFVPKEAPIAADYYRAKITIGTRLGDYDEDTKMKYKSVVEDLKKMGFTNIRLYRNNALTTGWVDSEGSIASFYIDGKAYRLDGKWTAKVSGAEPFYRDVLIEIVVNTKNKGCDEITEYREK